METISHYEIQHELLNLEEASKYLRISKSYLYKLTSAKQIPYYKPTGKLIFFLKSEIEQWVLQGKILTCDETTNQFFNINKI